MATFRKRGTHWQVQVRKTGMVAQSKTFPTKAAAQRWARRLEVEIDDGRSHGKAAVGTLGELLTRYEHEFDPLRRFGRTKTSSLGIVQRGLGAIRLKDLSAGHIIRWARQRHAEGAGPVTIGIDLSYLGTALRTARSFWQIGVSDQPVKDAREALRSAGLVDKPRERNRRPTLAELEALFEFWDANPRQMIPMTDISQFAIASAMRLGEICRIEWGDLNATHRTIVIRDRKDPRAKAGNDEEIPLLDVTGYDAMGLVQRQAGGSALIFPYKPASVGTAFERACKSLGIEGLTFHDLRHEGTSRLFEAKLRIEQVALITGHKDWRTLRRYTQLRPRDITAAFPPLAPLAI
jgi:integrase